MVLFRKERDVEISNLSLLSYPNSHIVRGQLYIMYYICTIVHYWLMEQICESFSLVIFPFLFASYFLDDLTK